MLKITFFGTGRLHDADAEIALPSRRWTLPLLAYLLLHRDQPVPRWRLAFTIWPDEPEEIALQKLRRNLHLLLRALPKGENRVPWMVVDDDAISWNPAASIEFDVADFERLRGDASTCENAVGLYGSDLLDEIYDDWIVGERERLRGLYLSDLIKLIVAKRGERSFDAARRYAELLLQADPWREDALRHLIAARYEAGDAAGALAEFERFARVLHAEMRVQPMPETIALRDAIARGDPVSPPRQPAELGARETVATPLVGRDAELTRLRLRWERAALGDGGALLLHGDAGMGKTRLASELALIAESQGGRVLVGATTPIEAAPYECLTTALRLAAPLVAATRLAPPLVAALAELVPELRSRRPDLPALVRLDVDAERRRLYEAFAQLVALLAKPRPVLLVFEDLHWAGAATIDAIAALIPQMSASPALAVLTYRDEEISPAHPLRSLERSAPGVASVSRVPLGPLDERAMRALLEHAGVDLPAVAQLAATLYDRSGGNPLFATEMLRDALRGESAAVPASIAQTIERRIDGLDPVARAVAEVAAVAGVGFTLEIVREVAALPETAVLTALDELMDRHLVRESLERGRYEYAFTHHLVQEAVYDASAAETQTRRHRRIAHILEALPEISRVDREREIAVHYELGDDLAAAGRHYAAAAQRAGTLYANHEARELVDRAVSLGTLEPRAHFELLLIRERADARLGDADAREKDLACIESLAASLDDEAAYAAIDRRFQLAYDLGELRAQATAIDALKSLALRNGDRHWLGVALRHEAVINHQHGRDAEALETALAAWTIFDELDEGAGCARAASLAALAAALIGRAEQAKRLADKACALAGRSGDVYLRLGALREAATVAHEINDGDKFVQFSREGLDLSLEIGDPRHSAVAYGQLGTALCVTWRELGEAVRHLERSIALFESMRSSEVGFSLTNLAALLGNLGEFERALGLLERAALNASSSGRLYSRITCALVLAEAAWKWGRPELMREPLHDAALLARGAAGTRYLPQLRLNQGRRFRCIGELEASAVALREAREAFHRLRRADEELEALDDLTQTLLLLGRAGEAQDMLEDGRRLAGRLEHFENSHRHFWVAACACRALGDREDAQNALHEAYLDYLARRGAIDDEALVRSFDAIAFHRAILDAHDRDRWPEPPCRCVVGLPLCGAVPKDAAATLPR